MTDGLMIGPADTSVALEAGGGVAASVGGGSGIADRAAPVPLPDTTPAGAPNPTLRLDPALGLVVLEYSAGRGDGTTSIPTAQQLEAYRTGAAYPPGVHPPAGHKA